MYSIGVLAQIKTLTTKQHFSLLNYFRRPAEQSLRWEGRQLVLVEKIFKQLKNYSC